MIIRKFKVILIITALGLGIKPLYAQDSTMTLSLDKAIEYALQNNKVIQNARFSSQAAKEKIRETTAAGLPQISASADYNNFLGAEAELRLSESAPPAIIEFNPTSNFKFNVSQLVFSGSYYVGLQLSKLASQMSEMSSQKTELDVKEQVTRAYYLILISEQTLKIIESNRDNSILILEKTKNLANAGIIEKTEVSKLSVMVTSVENAQKAAERQLEMAYNMLRFQLGVNAGENIKLITSLDEISQQSKFETAMVSPFNIEHNTDFNLVFIQEKMRKSQVSLEQASYLPTLGAYYSYTEKLLKPKFDMMPKNVVGLNLSIPIFSSGLRHSKLSQAKINLTIAENTKELVNKQLTIQEKQLRFNLNNLLEQYQNQKINIETAKEVLEKMNLKFQQGIVSSLELTSANNSYLSAESGYITTLFQLLDAELALRKLNGNL
ncbi:MAG: TolC family protein [Bacteroidales bacterium]|nr:TolC family protein [Bacteroidales bacterium]